jgi:hypothetical protein
MTAHVLDFPGAPAASEPQAAGLNLSEPEIVEASGGYTQPVRQLRELHARGFTRAFIPKVGRKRVVVERAHYDAVVRGQFAQQQPEQLQERPAPRPNRAGLLRMLNGRQ